MKERKKIKRKKYITTIIGCIKQTIQGGSLKHNTTTV